MDVDPKEDEEETKEYTRRIREALLRSLSSPLGSYSSDFDYSSMTDQFNRVDRTTRGFRSMIQLPKYQLPEEMNLNIARSMTGESGRLHGRERVFAYLMDSALKEYFGQSTTFSQVPQECLQQLAEVYMRQSGLDGLSVYATATSYVYGFIFSNSVVVEPQVMLIGYRVFEHDIQISFLLGPMTSTGHIAIHAGLSLFITAAVALAS